MEDTLQRRSRWHRSRKKKTIELRPRDIEIFKLLQQYRYLRSNFIYAFVGGKDETRFKKRIGELFHQGYLNRPKQQKDAFNARYSPAIYELDKKGEEALRQLGVEPDSRDLVARGRMGAIREFQHSMMVCDTLASIELGLSKDSDVEFVSWQQIINRAPAKTRDSKNPFAIPVSISYTYPKTGKTHHSKKPLIPDGLFGLHYKKTNTYRFFALEAERRNRVFSKNLQQTSGLRKVLSYREIAKQKIYKSRLGLPNLMVMFVTPNDSRIETYKKLIQVVTKQRGNKMFLFRHIPVMGYSYTKPVPLPSLYTGPWTRVGYDDFFISHK